jgi:hypothetical protein
MSAYDRGPQSYEGYECPPRPEKTGPVGVANPIQYNNIRTEWTSKYTYPKDIYKVGS